MTRYDFNRSIRDSLITKKISQEALAKKVGVASVTISRWFSREMTDPQKKRCEAAISAILKEREKQNTN